MANRYDEIKDLLRSSRSMLSKPVNEDSLVSSIKALLTEQDATEPETAEQPGTDENEKDMQETYKVFGGEIVVHGKNKKQIQLTVDEKNAFKESMDNFVSSVSHLVEFNPLNIYESDIEWSGSIMDKDVRFYFSVGENNGIHVDGDMSRIDEEYMDFINNIKQFYEQFKVKWGNIITSRKKWL